MSVGHKLTATYTHIARILWNQNSAVSIIASACLALSSLFYIYTLASFLKVNIFPLRDRINYDTYFSHFIVNKYADEIVIASGIAIWLALSLRGKARFVAFVVYYGGLAAIAATTNLTSPLDLITLFSIPVVIAILFYSKLASRRILNNNRHLFLNYLSIISIGAGIITITISIAKLFSIPTGSVAVRDYAYDIFVIVSSVSPILIILLTLCFPIKILHEAFISRLSNMRSRTYAVADTYNNNSSIKKTHKIICISLFILFSICLVLIPHQTSINKNKQYVGVDTHYYVTWQNSLAQSKDVQQFMHQAFVAIRDGDRPFTLVVVFGIVKGMGTGDPSPIIDNLPIIFGPALILIVYFLTREITSNDNVSVLASFITAVSFQTLVGIYAGFYANWFGLIIGYLSLVFLFRFLKKSEKLNFVIYSVLMVLLIFSHEYTWTIFAIVMSAFLVAMLKFKYYPRGRVILLLLIVLSTVAIDLTKNTVIGKPNGLVRDIGVAHTENTGLAQFSQRWSNLKDTMQHYYGAQFGNSIILILGLYWLFRCNMVDRSSIFLIIFLSIGIIPLFFGDFVVQSRVFYDIPFQIPAAIGLNYIRKQINGTMYLLPICLWLVAISVRAVSNFIFPS